MKLNYFLPVVLTALLSVYFSYSALNGQYGLFNQFNLKAQENVLVTELKAIELKNSILEKRVLRLSNKYLDLDLLDQQARKFLGLAKSNEIIINLN
tara:strand:- start:123 stop:410 length:288 start_codon:yes stop_codon:yes gene_type:complete